MGSGPLEKILSDELKSGLKITLVDEASELYARVSWIQWDSGFRDSGLAVEDRIVALNDVALALPEDPKARRIARDRMIGGLEVLFGHDVEGAHGGQCSAVFAVQFVDTVTINDQLALLPARQVEVVHQAVARVVVGPVTLVVHARTAVVALARVVPSRVVQPSCGCLLLSECG